ncbi:membrane protein [Actinomycetospora chlora]|uniref:Membrane protein n=1 Tax=Actinomycetospora chlora TaxID=663608 RepID=A0ABP9AN92_9PSEU
MTDQSTGTRGARDYRTTSPATSVASEAPSGAWSGWVRFGAVVMVVVGVFGVIEGLAAVLSPTYFVAANGQVFVLSWGTWGWVHLVLGALVAIVGASLLGGGAPSWARGAAIALVALSAIVHLVLIPVAPVWSIVVIALDVVVLYALVTTWGEPLAAQR